MHIIEEKLNFPLCIRFLAPCSSQPQPPIPSKAVTLNILFTPRSASFNNLFYPQYWLTSENINNIFFIKQHTEVTTFDGSAATHDCEHLTIPCWEKPPNENWNVAIFIPLKFKLSEKLRVVFQWFFQVTFFKIYSSTPQNFRKKIQIFRQKWIFYQERIWKCANVLTAFLRPSTAEFSTTVTKSFPALT